MTSLWKGRVETWRGSLDAYWDRRMLVILLLGFSSGLPLLLTLSTLSTWLALEGVSKTSIGLFALVGIPYSLKFLWAPVIDHVPLPLLTGWLGQRRGWAVVIQLGLMAAIVWLGSIDPKTDLATMAVAAFVVAFLSASQDIVIDAYRIEILENREMGPGSAVTQVGYRFGILAAGAGAFFLAARIDWMLVYAIEAALVTVGLATILACPEPKVGPRAGAAVAARGKLTASAWLRHAVVEPFADFMTRPGWAVILLFILLYKFGDAFAGVMANPFYVEMKFSLDEIAAVSKIFGMLATLAGIFLGGIVVYRYGFLKSLLVCGILQMLSNLMFSVQAMVGHDILMLAATIGIENLSAGMGSAAFVAYLSSLCNVAFTGTQYALLSSVMAVGRTVLAASSGWLADSVDWVTFFAMSAVVALPGLLLLLWMMRRAEAGGAPAPAG